MTTGIAWTDETWNVTRGCDYCSAGCKNCYAAPAAARVNRQFKALGRPEPYAGLVQITSKGARWTGETMFVAEKLAEPLHWKKPKKIFVNSMSDLFHDGFTNEQIAAVFGVMAACPQHTFQVLTKRAKQRLKMWFEWAKAQPRPEWLTVRLHAAQMIGAEDRIHPGDALPPENGHRHWPASLKVWPLPNVWLGVSVENQDAANERIPELLATPAAIHFLSMEPLLSAVDLNRWVFDRRAAMRRMMNGPAAMNAEQADDYIADVDIDWVIAGCESGPGARDCEVDWLRSLRDQCAKADVPFFLKQAEGVRAAGGPLVSFGPGSKRKGRGPREPIIDLPYLDGVQHKEFPR